QPASVFTRTTAVVAAAPSACEAGSSVYVQTGASASCVIVCVRPFTAISAVRGSGSVLAWTSYASSAGPAPDAACNSTQPALLVAVQGQPAGVTILTPAEPAADVNVRPSGARPTVQVTPCCETVWTRPATVSVVWRLAIV